jgi:hypothetical protein
MPLARRLALAALLVPAFARADDPSRCVDVEFTPSDNLQIVVWLEGADGTYKDTLFITQQTGTYGLGNRPGRYDFNSGPIWPYGRRITTFPVWSHRHGIQFPVVLFQSDVNDDPMYCLTLTGTEYQQCGENNLSHAFSQSSRELHFCRPLMPHEPAWDSGTCATSAFTDKGRFSATATTGYPPRTDLTRTAQDSPSVDMYKMLNPFDAVSQPTPQGGVAAHAPWAVPADLPAGDYVLWVEASKEFDQNATYTTTQYPSPPGIFWSEYGEAYRGQPSVVYRVPFTIGASATNASTDTYAGYGDPNGADGDVRPPDSTITTNTPGSGASRLQLVSDGGDMFRVRVQASPNVGFDLPGLPDQVEASSIDSSNATISFIAPGIGSVLQRVTGYEIRVRAVDPMTADNFASSMPISSHVVPDDAGRAQSFDLTGLLPQTDYWVGIRAYDGCHNNGDLAIVKFTTADRKSGTVDACFVATAAYGSLLANDVELLRHFRDTLLQSTALGELGVETYYTFGPAVAGVIGESDLLRKTARDVLAPVVAWVRNLAF